MFSCIYSLYKNFANAYLLSSEFSTLLSGRYVEIRMIPDNYEKIILSMDRNYISSYDGIKSLNLIDWLLN